MSKRQFIEPINAYKRQKSFQLGNSIEEFLLEATDSIVRCVVDQFGEIIGREKTDIERSFNQNTDTKIEYKSSSSCVCKCACERVRINICNFITPESIVLDLGCGGCPYVKEYEIAKKVFLVDRQKRNLERISDVPKDLEYKFKIIHADYIRDELPIELDQTERINLVCSFSSLEMKTTGERFILISKLANYLPQGGVWIGSTSKEQFEELVNISSKCFTLQTALSRNIEEARVFVRFHFIRK